MPLAAENFVQENSGVVTTAANSCVVSLPSGTTAGNTLFVFLTAGIGVGTPANFVQDKILSVNLYAFRQSEVAASETSWTFSTGGSTTVWAWYVAEVSDIGPVEPLDASATSGAAFGSTSNGGTRSTGTAALNASLNTVVFGAWSAAAGSASASWSGYTNDFEEIADLAPGVVGGYQLAVARKFVTGVTGTFESTATLATSEASLDTGALLVAYQSADSPIAAPLAMLAGFEGGTHGGINSHTGPSSLMGNAANHSGTWGTSYLIQASSARNSNYGLQVVQSGAAAYVRAGDLNVPAGSFGFDVRVVSATGSPIVAAVVSNIGSVFAQLLYDASTSKFGVRAGTSGTVSWQSGTTATNTWVWVDLRVKINTSTWHVDWRLETGTDTYTDQTAAELSGQSSSNTLYMLQFGYNAVQTITADFDNAVLSTYYVAYPLGPHQIRLLTVDMAGTPTVSGTSSNFSVFTANGTLGAWNATNARNAVDEVPPTVSASADGVVQTATAAGDYIEFPMDACTLAADEVIDGVRELAAMWGGAGAGSGTVGIRGWDGTTETTLIPATTAYDAGSPTAISSTEPRWQCAMWPFPSGGWTQTRLDGVSLRFGFSSDAAPDMGCHALYLEYATHKARLDPLFGAAGAVPRVEAETDPNTFGIRALRTYTGSQALEVTYEVSGSPTTYTAPADSNPHTQVIDGPDMATVNWITAKPA